MSVGVGVLVGDLVAVGSFGLSSSGIAVGTFVTCPVGVGVNVGEGVGCRDGVGDARRVGIGVPIAPVGIGSVGISPVLSCTSHP